MAAKAVYKERKQIWDGIDPNLLARPPRGHHGGSGGGKDSKKREEAQAGQYRLWKRRLAFERTNPEVPCICVANTTFCLIRTAPPTRSMV